MKTSTKKGKSKRPRNVYTLEQKEAARKYYLLGLSLAEISRILGGCSVRTLELWQKQGQWTKLKRSEKQKLKVLELHESGKSYNDIARLMNLSRATVGRYLKEAKDNQVHE